MKDLALAINDIVSGFQNREMWARMAWTDVRMRYKRTLLGPFWATLNMMIFIIALGLVFATLWKMELADYLPYLTSGFLVWNPIASIITESGGLLFLRVELYCKLRCLIAPLSSRQFIEILSSSFIMPLCI